MKLCYCDESGTGEEPVAVMVGILVDSTRMHVTKADWQELLTKLSELVGKQISELHTRNFYAGGGIWKPLDGAARAKVINEVFTWLAARKHKIVYTSVCKEDYRSMYALQRIPEELNTIWRFLGFHLALSLQRYCQKFEKNKGNTLLIFDNEEREQMRFTDLLLRPPDWSGEYYGKGKKLEPLDQIIDVPYFGDSQEVSLIQVADFVAYFLRRYAEIKDGHCVPKYPDEAWRIGGWVESLGKLSIGRSMIYPKVGRNDAEELFYTVASKAIRDIGS